MRLFPALFFFFASAPLLAQFHQSVFPGASGQELLDSLVASFKPQALLSNFTNDTLYKRIYLEAGDTLRCVYTDHAVYLAPGLDPSQAAFSGNINLEHAWPKAKGADSGAPESDMHHLFPSRADVNNYRGNLPFLEVNDPEADFWFYRNQTLTNIPATQIDLYSESILNGHFEPRESQKGNIARAMFYFYAMYKAQAIQADPLFFEIQRETLCQWHFDDPVDSLEWARTWLIAGYQDGKPNPFILDCTLPERSFCQGMELACDPSLSYGPEESAPFEAFTLAPNPSEHAVRIAFVLKEKAAVTLELYDGLGRLLERIPQGERAPGAHELIWEKKQLAAGPYWWKLQVTTTNGTVFAARMMILQ